MYIKSDGAIKPDNAVTSSFLKTVPHNHDTAS
jgi:hypothetical protein